MQIPIYGSITIPRWVKDLASYRRWVHSGVLPEKLAVHFIDGDVWVDFYMEEAFSHNQVKVAFTAALVPLANDHGMYFCDGMLVTNDDAGLGTEPDGMYVSDRSYRTGRVRFTAGETTDGDATEVVGSPDMVLEVVSPSSVDKDTEWLMGRYWDAGVREYWLVDAREEAIQFVIHKWTAKGFVPVRKRDEWVKSAIFGRSFRLIRKIRPSGWQTYTLEVR